MITGYAVKTDRIKLFGRARAAGEIIPVEETRQATQGALHALVSQQILDEIREGPEAVATRAEIADLKAQLDDMQALIQKLAVKAKVVD